MTQQLPLAPVQHRRYQPRPLLVLTALLGTAALLWLVALPLPWHHHDIPGDGYTVQYGYSVAPWTAVVAVPALGYAIRFSHWGFGSLSRLWLSVVAVVAAILMWVDYLDAASKAVSVFAKPWYGPGFAVAAAATLLLLVAAALSWRTDD